MIMANRTSTPSATRVTRASAAVARIAANAERRTRVHLRELCDEVLASYRVARGRDPISDADRAAAQAMLAGLMPGR